MSTLLAQPQIAPGAGMQAQPSPIRFFETMHAYQRTAALKAAIELEIFTTIGEGLTTVSQLAQRSKASERGVRAICDFLAIMGFLTKTGSEYRLTPDSAAFLDKKSPAYMGSATKFMASPFITDGFKDLVAIVRAGGPVANQTAHAENPVWVDFARSMAPLVYPVAEQTERFLRSESEIRVLDVAAGHGLFGILMARHNPKAKVVALDGPDVLAVARENAERFGVADRYTLLPGNALEVSFGSGFSVALVTNLLHHWDRATIHTFLKKVHSALAPKGRIAVVEFAPNDDRISPPFSAAFVMNMLATTPAGDAYTISEHQEMLRDAGFSAFEAHSLLPTPQTVIIALKK